MWWTVLTPITIFQGNGNWAQIFLETFANILGSTGFQSKTEFVQF